MKTVHGSAGLAPRKRPSQDRSRRTINIILEGAARILETPDHPFTTNHIAEVAGVSIGSLYQYFGNARAIVAALIHRHVDEEVAAATAILSVPSSEGAKVIAALIVGFVDVHAERPAFTSKLHALAPTFGLAPMMNVARDTQADAISSVLELDQDTTRMVVAAIEGALLRQLAVNPERLRAPEFHRVLIRIALAPFDLPKQNDEVMA